jgi:hypothetical protein
MSEHYQDRASQFLPYASLRGFDELVKKKEYKKALRPEISEDVATVISHRLSSLSVGDLIRLVYFFDGRLVTVKGGVERIDFTFRTLRISGRTISFFDVVDIGALSEDGECSESLVNLNNYD